MIRRRGIIHDEENTDRWLISYADFITLLFAFFVVMYSVSSVNLGKYRVLSDSMNTAFNQLPGQPIKPAAQLGISVQRAPISVGIEGQVGLQAMKETAALVEDRMKEWIKTGQIAVRGNEKWLEVEINTSILFESGEAELAGEARLILSGLADVFKSSENPIYVSGYTDNIPISTRRYPTNWELSAARSASVVRLMAEAGLNPTRLGAIGFAEFRPVAGNDTADNRQKNRRVTIRMLAGEDMFGNATPFSDTTNEPVSEQIQTPVIEKSVEDVIPILQIQNLQPAEPARTFE